MTFIEKLNSGYYDNIGIGISILSAMAKEIKSITNEDAKKEAVATAKVQINRYFVALRKAEDEFIKDMFEHYKVADIPKVEKAYSLAYGYGHTGGYAEIHNYFIDLIDLIK